MALSGIRMMSFNVRGSFRDRGTPNAWTSRAALNVETIRRCSPDVIGIQELQSGNLDTYEESLPRYNHVPGPLYGNGKHASFNSIFFDKDRLRLLDSGGFWLSETPGSYSSSWDSKVVRSANWAHFELTDRDLSFLHLNTHLDHVSKVARVEGGGLILREISDLLRRFGDELPVVMTGDFNCRPGTPTYRNFLAAGYVDTCLAAGGDDGDAAHTFHAFKGSRYRDAKPGLGPRRIDWILLKDPEGHLRPVSHSIVRDRAGETYPSDHYPILTVFALGQTRRGSPETGLPQG